MRCGIMQPYFFPYIGHFALIEKVDRWLVFDLTQYTPKTWINRNRVLHPKEGTNWVSVPLSNGGISIKISDARILNIEETWRSVLGKLSHYKRKAPYFDKVQELVNETFRRTGTDSSLVQLNVHGLDVICGYIGLEFNREICSDMDLRLPQSVGRGEWALELSSAIGADIYVNPISGREIFEKSSFSARGVDLKFFEAPSIIYDTGDYKFIENLSILDVLLWNAPANVRSFVCQGKLVD